jgi:hypothetical protein
MHGSSDTDSEIGIDIQMSHKDWLIHNISHFAKRKRGKEGIRKERIVLWLLT